MQGFAARQRATHARIQQLVQQQWIQGQALGQQRTARHHVHQARQRAGLLVQQCQVTGTAQDGMQQDQQTFQRGIGLRGNRRGFQQGRQYAIQARTRDVGKTAHATGLHKVTQRGICIGGLHETGGGQRFRFACLRQGTPVSGQGTRRDVALAGCQQFAEFGCHARALHLQRRQQRLPVLMPQPACDTQAIQRVDRQHMGLRIPQHLHAVF